MTFWDKITGADMTKQMKNFDARVKQLPGDYQAAWQTINAQIWSRSDFTGRNLMPILANLVDLFEETAEDGLSATEVLGNDIADFTAGLANAQGIQSIRDKWRAELNQAVHEKLGK